MTTTVDVIKLANHLSGYYVDKIIYEFRPQLIDKILENISQEDLDGTELNAKVKELCITEFHKFIDTIEWNRKEEKVEYFSDYDKQRIEHLKFLHAIKLTLLARNLLDQADSVDSCIAYACHGAPFSKDFFDAPLLAPDAPEVGEDVTPVQHTQNPGSPVLRLIQGGKDS